MLAGPLFSREVLTAPRRVSHYLMRAGYVAALFVLMYTAGQATFGWQQSRSVGDLARFGSLVFQVFSLIQLSLVLFFAMLFAAGTVAQEKDRRTLILLLMTDLHNHEMVLGKLLASLLAVGVLIGASVPVFAFVHLLGGVTLEQIIWAQTICLATGVAAGSWGALMGFWREKTFQTVAFSVLGLLLFLGATEAIAAGAGVDNPVGRWAAAFNPYRAMISVLDPLRGSSGLGPAHVSAWEPLLALTGLGVLLNLIAIVRLRAWNPSQLVFEAAKFDEDAAGERRARHRPIWDNPVIWREICTWAYGRKVFIVKLAYFVLAGFAVASLWKTGGAGEKVLGMISPAGFAFVGLSMITLMLVNAQAVTALTSERDQQTLDLLLMTDVSAKEFIFGKLGGILYNTKELIAIPLLLAVWQVFAGRLTAENFVYLFFGYAVLVSFAAMLGLHSGLSYEVSRAAIANSLGTMFFLFVGIFIFMMLLVEARSSFFLQFQSFLVFIGMGSLALYASLSHRNPSSALRTAALVLPFLTFWTITEFLREGTLGVCVVMSAAYGFATAAMLVPAVSEFDVALGRTTLDKG